MQTNHLALGERGVVKAVFLLLAADDTDVRTAALRALTNLGATRQLHVEMFQLGAVDVVIRYLRDGDTPLYVLLASLFLSMVSENPATLSQLVDSELIATLFKLGA
jgi:hypothetical protein